MAGAHSVVASLWDVNDASTTQMMRQFYGELAKTQNKANALQTAIRDQRQVHPHPYHWAPFILAGNYTIGK
jgi:CHAT domain-containing protein